MAFKMQLSPIILHVPAYVYIEQSKSNKYSRARAPGITGPPFLGGLNVFLATILSQVFNL